MKCPFCSTPETKVVDSRMNQQGDLIRRRRECLRCEGRFTTYERVEEVMPVVIKKDGRREAYSREKLLGGIQKACQKRTVPMQKIEEAVARIEKRIQGVGLKEIPSRAVGEMAMIEVQSLDPVAYVRFASVYRDFQDLNEFVADLNDLKEKTPRPAGATAQDSQEPATLSFPFLMSDEELPRTPPPGEKKTRVSTGASSARAHSSKEKHKE